MTTFITTTQINRHIGSELFNGQFVYTVEWTGDENEQHKEIFYNHVDAYAFVKEIFGF